MPHDLIYMCRGVDLGVAGERGLARVRGRQHDGVLSRGAPRARTVARP
jgi:hypothetical protein